MARNGYKLKDVAEILDITESSVYTMKKAETLPRFDKVYTLIEKGMTLEEIFGAELSKKLLSENPPEDNPLEVIMKKPPEMTEEEFDRKLKGSLKRLLGNLDIK